MDPILAAQLAVAGLLGAVGGLTISEVRNHYRVNRIIAAHERQAEEWRRREDEEVKAQNLFFALSKTFPLGTSTNDFKEALDRIRLASEALGHIHSISKEISPNNLHTLTEYLRDLESKKAGKDKSLVHSSGAGVK